MFYFLVVKTDVLLEPISVLLPNTSSVLPKLALSYYFIQLVSY